MPQFSKCHDDWSCCVLKSSKPKRKIQNVRALQFNFTLSTKPLQNGALTVVVDGIYWMHHETQKHIFVGVFKARAMSDERIVNYHGLLTPILFTTLLFISISSPICQTEWNLSGLFPAFDRKNMILTFAAWTSAWCHYILFWIRIRRAVEFRLFKLYFWIWFHWFFWNLKAFIFDYNLIN